MPSPAASKIPEICTPEWAGTVRTRGGEICSPAASKIRNCARASTFPGLKAPTLVRKPATMPFNGSCRMEVRTDSANALPLRSPGMNIPTVFCGDVE